MLCLAKCQCSSQFQQTKSGIALLYNEETNNTYDVCLKLTKEVLTIQKLDVVCTSGSESQVNVSAPEGVRLALSFLPHNSTILFQFSQYPFANKKLPLSKAQNCCTAKTGSWRSGLKHQSKQISFDYGETKVEMKRLWMAEMTVCLGKLFWQQVATKTEMFFLIFLCCFSGRCRAQCACGDFKDFQRSSR